MPLAAAGLALALALGGWLHYLWLIPQERVPAKPVGHSLAHLLAIGLAIASAAVSPSTPTFAAAAVAIPLSLFFLWLLTQAALPDGEITLKVGDPLPAFTARTDADQPWSPADALQGRRTLFKLFRGAW